MILENENGLLLMRHEQLGERDWRSDPCYKIIFSPYASSKYQTPQGDIQIHQNEFFIFNPVDHHRQLQAATEKFLIEVQPAALHAAAEQMGIKKIEPEFSFMSFRHPQIQQWMSFVRDFLSLHETSSPSINQLFLDNSLTQLAHLFKEEMGLSPYSWLQMYRLFRSQYPLLYTQRPILSIALHHGFKSVASYNHLFKKVYRKTPSEFRRIHGMKN